MKGMLRILLASVMVFFGANALAQQINESFEGTSFPPSGWKTVHVQGTVSWEGTLNNPYDGSRAAFINFEPTSGGKAINWLISPKILQIQAADKLEFFVFPNFADPVPDTLFVIISNTTDQLTAFTDTLHKILTDTLSVSNYTKISLSLNAYVGVDIYIGFRHSQLEGNGLYLDLVQAGSPLANDAGVTAVSANYGVAPTGTPVDITATIKNLGTNTIPAGMPVRYTVNGGAPVTINTSTPINSGSTQIITFSGANAFTAGLPGIYNINVFTDYAIDGNNGNDAVGIVLEAQNPIATYPYFEDFEDTSGWSLGGSAYWQFVNQISGLPDAINDAINPNGQKGKSGLSQFYFSDPGDQYIMSTPIFDFTGVAQPMLNFYVTYRTVTTQNDQLQVVVSLDGGLTWQSIPVLYIKSYNTNLSTLAPSGTGAFAQYVPQDSNDWRLEIVDLSAYAGQSNVIVGFLGTSDLGNNLWVDNVEVLSQDPSTYAAELVTLSNTQVTGPFNSSVNFQTVPNNDSIRMQGHNAVPPNSGLTDFEPNTTATSGDGSISSPNYVFPRYQTVAFSGNSIIRAQFIISLDISGLMGLPADLGKLYIMKRADQTDKWKALTTTRSGNILTASGLNKFGVFAVGYYNLALPVTLISFNGRLKYGQSLLDWQSAQEVNLSAYVIERKTENSEWEYIGTVPAMNSAAGYHYYFTDQQPAIGDNYYRLRMEDKDGSVAYSDIVRVQNAAGGNWVSQNIPNPFSNTTLIKYYVAQKSDVRLVIYDAIGTQLQVLESGIKEPGVYEARWNAGALPAGNYIFKLMIGNQVYAKQMIKLR